MQYFHKSKWSRTFVFSFFFFSFSLLGEAKDPNISYPERAAQSGYNLPLLIIETGGREIPKDPPRIQVDMGIINNSDGINNPNDPWNEYSGKISIKIRGETSSNFPKKSFTIELQNADGSNNNVSILGLPVENDFVIYSPYSDKTMIKNVLTFELFRRTGHWAPKTRYVEVFIDGDYRGISVLMESIKRDENRVDIDKLNDDDITGGYLLRRDKNHNLAPREWWTNPVSQPYHEQMWYEYFDPEIDELSTEEAAYIRNWMRDFDAMMSGSNFNDPVTGYDSYIKTKSFVDMMFINEISKGIDNYLFSTYFHKESDEDGGQFAAGPPWDYNLSYGNLNYGDDWDAPETYGWCYTQGSRVYWFERLMEDDLYRNKTMCRWTTFRANIFSDRTVTGIIDSCVQTLGPAVHRNFEKFSILGEYVWPAKEPFPETYAGEVDQLRSWVLDRLEWIDDQWLNNGNCSTVGPTNFEININFIDANAPVGSRVGHFTVDDEDKWDYFDYRFVTGDGDDDNNNFYIDDNVLYTVDEIDSNKPYYSIRVKVVDSGGNELEKTFILVTVADTPDVLAVDVNESVYVYPNPTEGYIQLKADELKANSQMNTVISTISGVKIFDETGSLESINEALSLRTVDLSSGLYLITITTDQHHMVLRFLKQ